ncbi:MAG: hypothetical protein JWP15_3168 [Alphaproteobacteria bacterium]|nr:hypothetical protein [Alphaproteobacteria bacterium]
MLAFAEVLLYLCVRGFPVAGGVLSTDLRRKLSLAS